MFARPVAACIGRPARGVAPPVRMPEQVGAGTVPAAPTWPVQCQNPAAPVIVNLKPLTFCQSIIAHFFRKSGPDLGACFPGVSPRCAPDAGGEATPEAGGPNARDQRHPTRQFPHPPRSVAAASVRNGPMDPAGPVPVGSPEQCLREHGTRTSGTDRTVKAGTRIQDRRD